MYVFLYINPVYVEILSLLCCKKIIFHKKTALFKILWAIFDFLFKAFHTFFQPVGTFEKLPSQMKSDEEHLFEEQLVGSFS